MPFPPSFIYIIAAIAERVKPHFSDPSTHGSDLYMEDRYETPKEKYMSCLGRSSDPAQDHISLEK